MRNDDPIVPAPEIEISTDTPVEEQYRPAVMLERPYRVIIHNDDVTTFDFVIAVLVTIFKHARARADSIAWEAHTNGLAYVCSLPLREARRRVSTAHQAARAASFPLQFTIEPDWLAN